MTSYYGEKGMYFVYDVTESVPIYVNLDRNPVLNSCIEMYLAPPYLTSDRDNSVARSGFSVSSRSRTAVSLQAQAVSL